MQFSLALAPRKLAAAGRGGDLCSQLRKVPRRTGQRDLAGKAGKE